MLLHQVVGGQTTDDDDGNSPCHSTSSIWIDMENVRGKSGFQLTHREVLDKTQLWTKHFRLEDKVIVVVDHGGPAPSGFFLEDKRMAVVFSGNACKADDIIARGVGASCFPFFGTLDEPSAGGGEPPTNGGKRGKQRRAGATGKTIVVTADNELIARCRRGAKNEYHIVNPQTFLDDLEWVVGEVRQQERQNLLDAGGDNIGIESSSTTTLTLEDEFKLGRLDTEIKLRGQLIDAEVRLGDKKKRKKLTNKRRKKLESRIESLRRKLALRGPSLLDQLTQQSSDDGKSDSSDGSLAREQQDLLLARWRDLQKRPPQKEQTGDRVIYAERLRRELEADESVTRDMDAPTGTMLPSAKLFVRHINDGKIFEAPVPKTTARATISRIDDIAKTTAPSSPSPKLTKEQRLALITSGPVLPTTDAQENTSVVESDLIGIFTPELSTKQRLDYEGGDNGKKLQTLDIVVVSDTHGFEGQLGDNLPDGDVLLHLGDFALEGSHEKEFRGLEAFDKWLAKQSHDYKIVIRGNHDPFRVAFPTSKAMYVTTPTSINVGGFEFALVPHCTARKLSASGGLPPTCDLIASHVPPFKVLDRTYSGKHVGSSFLNNVVRGMALGPPRLWLVGHIHESRGVTRWKFARNKQQETTVINASNANSGCATHLNHGPVVVRIDRDDPEVQILHMDDKKLTGKQISSTEAAFYQEATTDDTDPMEIDIGGKHLLMSVDLGLKSGVSLFNSQGNLIRYEQFLFDRENLQEEFEEIIQQWEAEVAKDSNDVSNPWQITHIAIEGGDTDLLHTWAQAAPNHSILRVSPEEWRSELLNKKESQNGASSKEASRLIARQIVADFGTMEHHAGKFPTDVAESVCLGMYVARRLGWIEREPAVRRFTNGNIVTPKKTKVPVNA
jgi:Icc-related predicted phosphoesterase